MAKTLMEVVQQRLRQPEPGQTGLGAGQQVQQIQRAKTGKALQQVGPRASALGERQAAQLGQQALGQIAQQGQLQGLQQQQQAEEQAQAAQIQQSQLAEQREAFREQADKQLGTIEANFRRAQQEGDVREQLASAEQASRLARLDNDKYITQLQQEGARARLDDANEFRTQIQQSQYDNMLQWLDEDLDFRSLLAADQREFEEQLAKMDIQTAMNIMNAQIAAGAQRAMYSGMGSVASGAIRAGAEYLGSRDNDTDDYAEDYE